LKDTDVDMEDFGQFQTCFTGPNAPQTDPACEEAKIDTDEDVDQEDYDIFVKCLSSSDVPAEASCLN
jgi:hypothetical protein